ncbi:putative Ig domain-containing protein [Roseibium sp. Sym1]|uniref:putative Ig domain-containing protein n=1 Tax=Roseibium sp. Sym1 TaxID=3016006 RepID=UPI0022B3A116|nr:putative Ig domain-containing protein [Roseibium sp. Sym1]
MFVFNNDHIAELNARINGGEYNGTTYPANVSSFYARVVEILQEAVDAGETVPANVHRWFAVARDVNAGIGAYSDFIRNYTAAQIEIRVGYSPSDISNILQKASDDIGRAVFSDILANENRLPTLDQIGENDATETIDTIVESVSDLVNPTAIWSGNILFPALGVSRFFYEEIIPDKADTYELLTAAKAALEAGSNLAFAVTSLVDLISGPFRSDIDTSQALSVLVDAQNFFNDAYGGSLLNLATDEIVLDREGEHNTEMAGSSKSEIIHGAAGDDTIVSSAGNDILDGGEGIDTADYSNAENGLDIAIKNEPGEGVEYTASVVGSGIDALFNIEKLIGSGHNDQVIVRSLPAHLESLDAGEGDEDLLSTFYLGFEGNGVELDAVGGTLSTGDSQIEIANFEKFEGTNQDDTFVLDAATTKEVSGRSGEKDKADFSQSTEALTGQVTIKGIEEIVGTSFGDVITTGDENNIIDGFGGTDTLEAGAGNDEYVSDGEDTITDSTGDDTYRIDGDGTTLSDGDGEGTVYFGGLKLTGGEKKADESGCGNDHESDDKNEYEGSSGEIYKKSGSGLTVTYNGSTLTIKNWKDGQLGIKLDEEDPKDGSPCDPSPDNYGSPLVLDLDGDGIELLSLEESGAYFDIDKDGVRERTGWVRADDGLLTLDRNGNGTIDDAGELFGYGETYPRSRDHLGGSVFDGPGGIDIRYDSGFAQLADFDLNLDGVIDQNDGVYSSLRIWQDLDGDGVSDEGEFTTLAEQGVTSISLTAEAVSEDNNGNLVTDRGTFEGANGTGEISDVWFRFNQYDSKYEVPEDLDPAIAALPDLNGAGSVKPLHLAMSEQPELRALVEDFVSLQGSDLSQASALAEQILYAWAGVSNEDTATGRGRFADRRAVEVIEAFSDTSFAQWSGSVPRPYAGAVLNDQFNAILQATTAQLFAQSPIGQELFPELTFENNHFLILAENTNASDVLQRLSDSAPGDVFEALAHYQAGIRILDMIYLSFADVALAGDEGAGYRADAEALLASAGIDLSYEDLVAARVGSGGDDSFLTESFAGNQYGDKTPVVSGGAGDDAIVLGGNKQILFWGAGQGTDTVTLDPFSQQGWDTTPRVELRLANLNRSEISFSRIENALTTDAAIKIDATGEMLIIRGLLEGTASGVIRFADGEEVSFADFADEIAALAETGTDGNDLIIQVGTSALDGGAGNDILQGAARDTDYKFGIGSGRDVIQDTADGVNRVLFGEGVTPGDLTFTRSGGWFDTLEITINGTGDTLIIRNQYDGSSPIVSAFVFEDGTTLTPDDLAVLFQTPTDADDQVFGTTGADYLGNEGTLGNDTFRGLDGGDTYFFEAGSGQDTIEDLGSDATTTDANGNVRVRDEDVVEIEYDLGELTITYDDRKIVFLHEASGDQLTVMRTFGKIETFNFGDAYGFSENDVLTYADSGGTDGAILGTADADVLDGTEEDDVILGLSGDDTLSGLGGNDRIDGGDGEDTVNGGEGNDILLGGSGFDILNGGDGDDILDGGDRGDTSSSLRAANELHGGAGNDQLYGGWRNDTLSGGEGNDLIFGDYGSDIMEGGEGDDVIVDNDGSATYCYAAGDGHDLIFNDNAYSSDHDVIEFDASISVSDVSFSFVYMDGSVYTDNWQFENPAWGIKATFQQGGSISFAGGYGDDIGGVDALEFADGTTLNVSSIAADLRIGTDADQVIVGASDRSDDLFDGGKGDDVFYGNRGDQAYFFDAGDGHDVIHANLEEYNSTSISFGDGITFDSLSFSRSGENGQDLVITLDTGDSITIVNQYVSMQDTDYGTDAGLKVLSYVDQLFFSDGTSRALAAENIAEITNTGTDGNDNQVGTGLEDIFAPTAGDDVLAGGHGSDIYGFEIGAGHDEIVETSDGLLYTPDTYEFEGGPMDLSLLRETDTLFFGDGISVSDLTFTAVGNSLADLEITIIGTGDKMLIRDQLMPDANWGRMSKEFDPFAFPPGTDNPSLGEYGEVTQEYWNHFAAADFGADALFQAGIEVFTFADGTSLTRSEVAALVSNIENDGDNNIRTDDTGGVLDGGSGNDHLSGGTGNDTYIFELGADSDIAEDRGGFDTIQFGDGITAERLAFRRVGEDSNDLLIEIGGEAVNTLLIEGQFAGDGREIEQFKTADGSVFTSLQIRQSLLAEAVTSGSDLVIGFENNDLIDAREGDDTIELRGGDDVVDGGAGRDVAVFRGHRSDYTIETDGAWTVVTDTTGRDGVNRLVNVEKLVFADEDGGEQAVVDLTPNLAPIANDIEVSGLEDTVLILNPKYVTDQVDDPDGDAVTLVSVGNASSGSVELDEAGRIVYRPDADVNGAVEFEYTVVDKDGAEAIGRVTVDLTALNDGPAASDDQVAGVEDQVLLLDPASLLANDLDIDGDVLSVVAVASPDADVSLTAEGQIRIAAPENFSGLIEFDYTVSDGVKTDTARVQVNIEAVNDAPVAGTPISDQTYVASNAFVFFVPLSAFSDVDGDDLSLSASLADGAALPDWLTFDQDTGVFLGEAPEDFAGALDVVVTASDGSETAQSGFSLTIEPANVAPVVASAIIDQSVDEDTAWSFVVPDGTFSDDDGDILSYRATLADGSDLPAWLGFDADTRTFSGTPPQDFNGSLDLRVVASDGEFETEDTFVLNITPVNDAPIVVNGIDHQFSSEDEDINFTIPADTFADVDGDALTLSATMNGGSPLPDWLDFDPATATFSGTPPQEYRDSTLIVTVSATATDPDGASVSDTFSFAITTVNDAPVLAAPLEDRSVAEDQAVEFAVPADSFTDIDDAELSFTARLADGSALPAWLAFDGETRAFSGTLPQDFNGPLDVTVTATDGEFEISDTFTLEITPVNDAPVVANALADRSVVEDTAIAFTLPQNAFADVDGDALVLSASQADGSSLPAWLAFDAGSRSFTGTPPQDFNGSLEVRVTASDGELEASDTFTLEITAENDAPVAVNPIGDQTSAEDAAISFAVPGDAFTDVDGDDLVLSASLADGSSLPAWLTFDADTRTFSGTPPQDFNGAFDVTVTASDGALEASDTFTLEISPVNDAPLLVNALEDQSFDEDTEISFTLPQDAFSDVDGDSLVFAASLEDGSPLPDWLAFDAETRSFAGTPPENLNGSLNVTVTASDGSLQVSDSFTLDIAPVNDAPVAVGEGGFVVGSGTAVTFAAEGLLANDIDIDGDALTITSVTSTSGNATVEIDADGNVVYTASDGFQGEDSFEYTISDGELTATATVSLLVEADDPYEGWTQGTDGDDWMFGDLWSPNQIYGAGGNDIIIGGLNGDQLAGGSGSDRLWGLLGDDDLQGNDGDDQLYGGFGSDTLSGGAGNDRLWGGWGRDNFVYATGGGSDTIMDFETGLNWGWFRSRGDSISIDVNGINSFDDLMATASQDGRNVVFDFGNGDELVLAHTRLAALDKDAFTFY